MADQNNIQLGIDIEGLRAQQKEALAIYEELFKTLESYTNKVQTPISGAGLSAFNKSLVETSALLDQLNVKLSSLGSSVGSAKPTTELAAAMAEYSKIGDQVVITNAKLEVSQSDLAKEQMANKLQLSETTKEILNNLKANTASVQAKELDKVKSQEYRLEQQRVVETLRNVAKEQDKQSSQNQINILEQKKLKTQEYRLEQNRVVETLRNVAKEQDKSSSQKQVEETKRLNEERKLSISSVNQLNQSEKLGETTRKNAIRDLANLETDYEKLTAAIKQQAAAYQQLYLTEGKDSPNTKAALADYKATSGIVTDIDTKLAKASGSTKLFGGALASTFGQLRTLAYILPGIGIAGIFNVAYEALKSMVEEMGFFNTELEKEAKEQKEVNSLLESQLALFNNIYDKVKDIESVDKFSQENLNKTIERNKTRGQSQEFNLKDDIFIAQTRIDAATKEMKSAFGAESEINTVMKRRIDDVSEVTAKLSKLNQTDIRLKEINKKNDLDKSVDDIFFLKAHPEDQLKAQKEALEGQLSLANANYKFSEKIASDYYSTTNALEDAQAKQFKFNQEERRRLIYETTKENISLQITLQERILNDEITNERQRINSIRKIHAEEVASHRSDLINVTSNTESTTDDKIIAENKFRDENEKSRIKSEQSIQKVVEEYSQRRIKATTEINKDEVEKVAIHNEKIYKDENQSLEDRLKSYSTYISKKQTLQDLEYAKDITPRRLRSNDPTVKKEIEALEAQRDAQKATIQADTEKQVYDIVFTSLQKQLKAVKDENSFETIENKKKYDDELIRLNTQLEQKKISYHKFAIEREKLDRTFNFKILDEAVTDDKSDLNRIVQERDINVNKKETVDRSVTETKDTLDFTKKSREGDTEEAQKKYDAAVGQQKALNQVIKDLNLDIDQQQKKLVDDEIARDKAKYALKLQLAKEYHDNWKKIGDALINLAKSIIDQEIENEITRVEQRKQIFDEGVNAEQSAIEKSSLSAKDKAALDIQLSAEKQANDKNADAQERKLKIDKAVADRALTIAHILWNTEESVSAALTLPPPFGEGIAIQRGVLGAIEVATVLATPIPTYKEGIKNHPGGVAIYGEAGPEVVKEPGKEPYLVSKETLGILPKDTEIIPIKEYKESNTVKEKETNQMLVINNNGELKYVNSDNTESNEKSDRRFIDNNSNSSSDNNNTNNSNISDSTIDKNISSNNKTSSNEKDLDDNQTISTDHTKERDRQLRSITEKEAERFSSERDNEVEREYKSDYVTLTKNVAYIPKGTEVVPIKDNQDISEKPLDDGWEQTRWLAKQLKKTGKESKNIINNTVNIDMGFERYKKTILGN